jgi:hypothetical protein
MLGFEVLQEKFSISEYLKILPSFHVEDPAQVLCTYPGSR